MTYDYICKTCGKELEVNLTVEQYLESEKPVCCGKEMKRVWTILKLFTETGSGMIK